MAAPCPSQREGKKLFSCVVVVDESELLFVKHKSRQKKDPHTAAELGPSMQGLVWGKVERRHAIKVNRIRPLLVNSDIQLLN